MSDAFSVDMSNVDNVVRDRIARLYPGQDPQKTIEEACTKWQQEHLSVPNVENVCRELLGNEWPW